MTAPTVRGRVDQSSPRGRPQVTLFHPTFGYVGGAEVLVLRHAALLCALDCDVRLVTRAYDADRWRPWVADAEIEVACVGRGWWEKKLYRGPRRSLLGAARRLAPRMTGSDAVVAYNAPAPAILGTLRPGAARLVWHCNEPPRALHFAEVTRTSVARVPAAPLTNGGGGTPPLDLGWVAQQLAEYRQRLAGRWRFALDRALDVERVRRIDRIVALSDYSAESVRLVYGRAADRVIPPPIPEPGAAPRRAGLDRAGGGLHVLAHARIEPLKNVHTLLLGFARFRAQVPGAHRLHVVGTGPWLDGLRAAADALGLADAVAWHGFLDAPALEAVYARCDVFALLPFDEPFGMVFPEAALRGLLLVGSDHGGPAEILDGGTYGWAVDAFDPEPLADALEEAWGLSDGEADRRRARAAAAMRGRYGAAAVGPQLRAAFLDDR